MLQRTYSPKRMQLYTIAVFAVFLLHLFRYAQPELWDSLYWAYYVPLVPVLIAAGLYLSREGRLPAEKVFLLYWAWVFLTRLLNRDFFLEYDADKVLNIGLACAMLPLCRMLGEASRRRFLDVFSVAVAGFYTLLALPGLYAVLYRKDLYNPITGNEICTFWVGYRLTILGRHANECALWFFISFFLLVYLFFRWKNLLCRGIVLPAAVLNYIILGMTFSRNAMLAFSICFALLAVLLVLERSKDRKPVQKAAVSLALLLALTPAAYLSFRGTAELMRRASAELLDLEVEEDTMYVDKRALSDSGRFEIYKSVIPTFRQEPMRLVRGCLWRDVMSVSNTVLLAAYAHLHNTYLQVLVFTGIPGFLLVLIFSALLALAILRLLFSDAPMRVKALTLILIGSFFYNLLEISLFVSADTRAFTAYIIAGAVLAYSREIGHARAVPLYRSLYNT